MSNPLPENMLAALLLTAGDAFDMKKAVSLIASGKWPVDAGYEFEGKNLIELAASNPHISKKPSAAIDLVLALAEAGVKARENSWRLAPPEDSYAHTRVFLRALAQGADADRLACACKALALIRPIKPVKERADKIVDLINKAGGFSAPLQGLDLISWMALHDFAPSAGGCATQFGNDDEHTTRRRIRNRVFCHKNINREAMTPFSRPLLDYRVAALVGKTETPDGFYATKAGVILAALDGVTDVDSCMLPIIGVRTYGMTQDLCTTLAPKYSNRVKSIDDRIDEMRDVLVRTIPWCAQSDDFFFNLSWIMMERPGMMSRLFPDPISLEKAGLSLATASLSFYTTDAERIEAAGNALYSCLRGYPAGERIAAGMEAILAPHKNDAANSCQKMQAFLLQITEAVRMEARTAPVMQRAGRAAPRI